ncbi:MAG: ParB/RepB/Spo0J family partition protein [Clostridia bacterium]|nr:ParB/RepB/Spo0J family partition protein [Clostridia bacterium]
MAVKKGGLGRGLDSLFNENSTDNNNAVTVNLNDIEPNRNQPRKDFDEQALSELADSIAKHGLIQPIVVKPTANGRYMIIAGERRWRASRLAGLTEVPVMIKDTDDQTLMELALIENLQREDLNPVEEALGYKALMDEYSLTQEKVSEIVGKSRSAVANALRLLGLNEEELDSLKQGKITSGHARALLSATDADLREKMFRLALLGVSVRELERMAQAKKKPQPKKEQKSNFYSEVELSLKNELHRKVLVKPTSKGKGTITIEFYNDKELADFAKKLAD